MRVTQNDYATHVYLSRRNLRSLLAKLDQDASECTLYQTSPRPVFIHAEEDAVAYANREPGPVSPETEALLHDGTH